MLRLKLLHNFRDYNRSTCTRTVYRSSTVHLVKFACI